jgi:hypothetical protein
VYVGDSDEPTANTVCAANQPANSAVNPLVEVTCATPVAGSSLYIYLPRQGILTLCEVEVIGGECLTGELFSDLCTDTSSVSYLKFKYMLIFVYACIFLCAHVYHE